MTVGRRELTTSRLASYIKDGMHVAISVTGSDTFRYLSETDDVYDASKDQTAPIEEVMQSTPSRPILTVHGSESSIRGAHVGASRAPRELSLAPILIFTEMAAT